MIIPANARLGRTYDDLAIGYQVLTALRETAAAWTAAESTSPGWWSASAPVNVPDTGGYIAWGLEGQPALAEEAIAPAVDLAGPLAAINRAIAALLNDISALLPPPPPIVVDTARFDMAVAQMQQDAQMQQGEHVRHLSTVAEALSALQDVAGRLTVLNDGANQIMALAEMQRKLNGILGEPTPGLRQVVEMSTTPTTAMAELQASMQALEGRVVENQRIDDDRRRLVGAVDRLLSQLEGR